MKKQELRDTYRGVRVLVTGHTGFKGSWLSLWLTEIGAEVIGISDGVPTEVSMFKLCSLNEIIDDHRCDVRDLDTVGRVVRSTQPEIIFHLAAQPIVRAALLNPFETFSVNVLGTAAILEAARSADSVRAVVVVTSDKVYRDRPAELGYQENDEIGGHEPYGASKAAAEIVAAVYRHPEFHRGAASQNVPVVSSARAGNVIGGGDWAENRLVPDIVRAITEQRNVTLRYPDAVRPWQHVLEPLSGYLILGKALLEAPKSAPAAVNFGPSVYNDLTVREVVDLFVRSWGPNQTQVIIEADESGVETGKLQVSSLLAERTLGWRPVWDVRRAVRESAKWYRAWADGHHNMIGLSKDLIETYLGDQAALANQKFVAAEH